MTWSYVPLKAADAALSPPVADPAAAAEALNAQMTEPAATPLADLPVATIHGVLMLASTGDWLRIQARAAQALSADWPASPIAADAPIAAAKNAAALAASKVKVVTAINWAAFLASIAVLAAAGDISSGSQAAIEALAVYTQPVWQPPVTAGDIQTARSIP